MKSRRDKAIYLPFLIQHDSFQKSSSLNNLPVLLSGWLHFVFSPLKLPGPKITHVQGTHLSLIAGALSLASQKFPVQREGAHLGQAYAFKCLETPSHFHWPHVCCCGAGTPTRTLSPPTGVHAGGDGWQGSSSNLGITVSPQHHLAVLVVSKTLL